MVHGMILQALTKIWQWLGSIKLTIVVLLLLVVDMVIGYWCLDRRTTIFQPLGDVGLFQWTSTYGLHNLLFTAWFFVLLGLLAVLVINTFVCTTEKVIALLSRKRSLSIGRFWLRLAPHIMHYAIIIVLAGYLSSYMLADVHPCHTLTPGTTLTIPNSNICIKFSSYEPYYYQGDQLDFFHDWVIDPGVGLTLSSSTVQRTTTLSYNKPVRYQGYTIILKDFYPKKKAGMSPRVYIDLSIRKDPGVVFYFSGMLLFAAGLLIYVFLWVYFKAARN
jgi:cytochrome c biogenesis protein ResB